MKKKKIKQRHNKKRNTLFLYEALVRELTKSIMKENTSRQKEIIKICKKNFRKDTLLYKEKELYSALLEARSLDKEAAVRFLDVVKDERKLIDNKMLFNEQTRLIGDVNKILNGTPFTNFVPGYKSLASIAQIFSATTPIKEKFLLEHKLIENMTRGDEEKGATLETIDNLAYRTFVKSFNEQYDRTLSAEQRVTIEHYVMSFSDNGVLLKTHLNEEIARLKEGVVAITLSDEVKDDSSMKHQSNVVSEMLNNMSRVPIDDRMINDILKIQALVGENEGKADDS